MNNAARIAGGALLIWVALGTPGIPTGGGLLPSAPYTGSMSSLHSAAGSMDAKDRQGLSEALAAIGKMVSDDRLGAIKTSSDAQRGIQTMLNFSYSSFQTKKYPEVASAIESELSKAVGTEVGTLSSSDKARIGSLLEEMGRAVK
jgi:hypothetical protein